MSYRDNLFDDEFEGLTSSEFAVRAAEILEESGIHARTWLGTGRSVVGWEIPGLSDYYSSESQPGRGMWTEAWGKTSYILGEGGQFWTYSEGRSQSSSHSGTEEYRLVHDFDLGERPWDDPDNRITRCIRDFVEERWIPTD